MGVCVKKSYFVLAFLFLLLLFSESAFAMRLAIYGDTRDPYWGQTGMHERIVGQIKAAQPEIVFNTGDLVKGLLGRHIQTAKFCASVNELANSARYGYMIVYGNHDEDAKRAGIFKEMQTKGACVQNIFFPPGEGWTEVQRENFNFFILNSNYSLAEGSSQFNWLKERLSAVAKGNFKFVFLHKPVVSIGVRSRALTEKERSGLQKLFSEHAVPAVFAGNDHAFSWCSLGPTLYIVTGGGGAELKDMGQPKNGTNCISSLKIFHWMLLETKGDGTVEIKLFDAEKPQAELITIGGITPSGYTGACSPDAVKQQGKLGQKQGQKYAKACEGLNKARKSMSDAQQSLDGCNSRECNKAKELLEDSKRKVAATNPNSKADQKEALKAIKKSAKLMRSASSKEPEATADTPGKPEEEQEASKFKITKALVWFCDSTELRFEQGKPVKIPLCYSFKEIEGVKGHALLSFSVVNEETGESLLLKEERKPVDLAAIEEPFSEEFDLSGSGLKAGKYYVKMTVTSEETGHEIALITTENGKTSLFEVFEAKEKETVTEETPLAPPQSILEALARIDKLFVAKLGP